MMRVITPERKYLVYSFVISFAMAVAMLLPFVIADGGYLIYYADYNAQQIPFYETCIKAIHNGETGWNWYTDMGVNFVGSYSFYTLGSPFFWLAVLLPAECSRYLLAPLLALKIGLASTFACAYIRRFVKKPNSAILGGILYAFSSFSLYNIIFNHFHEALCFFPLLLIGLEEAVVNKRKAVFAIAVAINAIVNYFFFFGEWVFLVIYFFCRMAMSKEFRISVGDFFSLAFESITGVLISCVLLLPSIFQVMTNNRLSATLTGSSFLFYSVPHYYGNILKSMFFVTDVAGDNTLFPQIPNCWDSTAMYLPLFSMVGVITFFVGTRKHWAKALLSVCLVFAFIPGLNSLFTFLNGNYYARWFYMPSLVCAMVTVYALENDHRFNWKFGWGINAAIVALMSLLLIFYPVDRSYTMETTDGYTSDVSAVMPKFMAEPMIYVYLYIGATVVVLIALYLFIRVRHRFTSEKYMKYLTVGTIVCSVLLGYGAMLDGRTQCSYHDVFTHYLDEDITIDDDGVYRIETILPCHDYNINMEWDMYSPYSFHSIVPSGTNDIYRFFSSIERGVISEYPYEHYAARALIGTKYYILAKDAIVSDPVSNGFVQAPSESDSISVEVPKDETFTLPGTSVYDENEEYIILKNDYAVPMAFAYDNYIIFEDIEGKFISINNLDLFIHDRAAVSSAVLNEDQVEKYSDILTPMPADQLAAEKWTDERLAEDAAARNAAGVKAFSLGKNSFHAETAYTDDELVVFSVPFDSGWSAVIDGTPVEIDKINGGFIAVRVPAGEHSVDFTYETPGLKLGILITVVGVLLLGGWIVLWYVVLKRGVRKPLHINTGISAHDTYIASASGDDTSRR